MSDISFRLTGENSSFRSMVEQSHNMMTKFAGSLSAIGIGLSAGAAAGFFGKIVEQAGSLQDLSERLGISTDNLQAFHLAAKEAGATTEQANMVFTKSKKSFDELAAGTPAVVAEFKKLGLTAESFKGMGMAEAIELTAKAFVQSKDKAGAYDAVLALMGEKALPAVQVAIERLGSEGLAGLNAALDVSGAKIESDFCKKADEMGDRFERAKSRIAVAGATLVSGFVALGEGIGTVIGKMVYGADALTVNNLTDSAKEAELAVKVLQVPLMKLTEEGEKQLRQQEKKTFEEKAGLARAERIKSLKDEIAFIETTLAQRGLDEHSRSVLITGLAEKKKFLAQDEISLSKDKEKHEARMIELRGKEIDDKRALLTFNQQMAALKQDEVGWQAVLADMSISDEVRRNAEVELEKTRDKQRDIKAKKMKEEEEMAKLLLKPATELTESEQLRLQVLQGTVSQKQLDEEKTRLIAGLNAGTLTPAEKERLKVLMDQAAVLGDQLEKAKAITVEVRRTGKSVDQQSDDSLLGVQQKLQSQINQIKIDDFGRPGGVGGKAKPAELYLLESELFNLQKELRERQEVRDYATRFGDQRARQQFGDTLFEKAMRNWDDKQDRTVTAIEDIQQRIKKLFPEK